MANIGKQKIKATPMQQARLEAYLLTATSESDLDQKFLQTKTTFGVDCFLSLDVYNRQLAKLRKQELINKRLKNKVPVPIKILKQIQK